MPQPLKLEYQIYSRLCPDRHVPRPRYAAVRTLYEPGSPSSKDAILDSSALVLYMPGPKTVTGEDILELHVHGGPAVVKAVLAAIPRCSTLSLINKTPRSSITYAEPGEFTRRAFINDRLDLTQIEALSDTLAATTEQQRRLSVRGTTGGLTKRYEAWRHILLHARGELEALIDFSEDQHFEESPAALIASVASQVEALASEIKAHCTNASRGELIRNGISLALLGAPNAGKSSLLNRIVGREAAIVSAEAGTTRDVVEVGVDLGGWYCRLGDMAGIRVEPTGDGGITRTTPDVGIVEQEGIKRAKQRAFESDVVLVVLSLEVDPETRQVGLRMEPEVTATAKGINERAGGVVVVVNKMDHLLADSPGLRDDLVAEIKTAIPNLASDRIFWISCKDANEKSSLDQDPGNIQSFLNGLIHVFRDLTLPFIPSNENGDLTEVDKSMWEESLDTNARQRTLLNDSVRNLDEFLREVKYTDHKSAIIGTAIDDEIDIVVAAESLRLAAASLGKITGRGDAGDVEEVLGVVFEKFCVGK